MIIPKGIQFRATIIFLLFFPLALFTQTFSGGGGSVYFGTGSPNTIAAASELADDLHINEQKGNYFAGIHGFYQAATYRLGGAFQAYAWGGVNLGENEAGDDAAGVGAVVGGLYSSYTLRLDRILLNVGAVFGAGRCFLGYSLSDGERGKNQSVSTFFIEPQVSLGVATCRWFGVEFQLSSPFFILTENLSLNEVGKNYSVKGTDMMGLNFSIKLTFGKVANPPRW
ncbi:MAG: hypothetical protein JSW33_06635 [bacterium]|nr:MAG: hypothetical protein JSW33_06635 [bacterium]